MLADAITQSRRVQIILGIALVCIIGISIFFSHEESAVVVIDRIEFQQEVHGTDGSIDTYSFYAIYTSNGLYRIPQSGLFARPDLIGTFKEGDTITIVSGGYDIPQAGIFRIIKDIKTQL